MIRREILCVLAASALMLTAACGGNDSATNGPPPAPPAAPAAPAPPKPATTVTLIEPSEGAMGGHIDTFRWAPVDGADDYVIKIIAVTGNRTVWESPPMKETETHLPPTVALEPEVHTWSVSARKGGQVLVSSPSQRFTITP
jgi:hypothetical protein